MEEVLNFLDENNIEYKLHEHPAVFTCEDAEKHCVNVPGLPSKNLFLRDDKKKRFFLVVMPAHKQLNLKKLGENLGVKKLGFASPNSLKEKLELEQGSVSPFGLINNEEKDVEVYVDKDIKDAEIASFHPNINTGSLEITKENFEKYLNLLKNKVEIIEI